MTRTTRRKTSVDAAHMTTRRTAIKTLAALPSALSLSPAWAAGDPSRLALVIGNSAYRDSPLLNPGNDARAMAGLFGQAGFMVDSYLDVNRAEMVAAIEKFGAAIRRPETRQVVFYYAGHGVQLDWRNYLAPIDAKVDTADQLRQHCVDLGLLLKALGGSVKNQTFIIILDACRDNPFGSTYRPEQAGLAQFDAPVGSLLAYATSPGKGAADESSSGKNGLYTEHLLRELSKRGTRIEDALKRVRLNVRLASRGMQVPWETTSLENDVFLFNDGQSKLSDAELERQIEADLAAWTSIKASRKLDDWVAYLRTFPNGRFAEIAQMRVARLMEESEKAAIAAKAAEAARVAEAARIESAKALALAQVAPAKVASTKAVEPIAEATPMPTTWAIELHAGASLPAIFKPSGNPYSAGYYPLGRKYTVGDRATFRETDYLSGVEQRIHTNRVTRVDVEADRVEINNGGGIVDLMGNPLKAGEREFDVPRQQLPAELQLGKKWTAYFVETRPGQDANRIAIDFHVARKEKITVPAGTFEAFLVEGWGWSLTRGSQIQFRQWLLPKLNFPLKWEVVTRRANGTYAETKRHELISLRQHAISD